MNRPRQGCAFVLGLFFFLAAARGELPFVAQNSISSVSGQFLILSAEGDPTPFRSPDLAANTNLVRLDAALLAVAAERFKLSLRQELGLAADAPWSGKIFLRLHPARSTDENVTITSTPFLDHWDYAVDLPDILGKMRYARALSAVLLLELANRSAPPGGHSAEAPDWLVDGLAQQVLSTDGETVVLSSPIKKGDALPVDRLQAQHNFDAFAATRQVLQSVPALTFDQLSWPTDEQMNGLDGGAYFASAQLFLADVLGLKDGAEKMRALLAELPACFNWQTAFFHAYGADFQRPLEVEKWWALRVVNFVARAPGPRWTTDVSLARLEQLLSVPVEFRGDSNTLPSHTEVSLQAILKNLDPAQRDSILRNKVRDLALVELRLAPPFGNLADGYRMALAGYLGEFNKTVKTSVANKHGATVGHQLSLADTLKRLDDLDRRRREAETRAAVSLPGNSQAFAP
jgi:hypothetical protein